MTDYHDDFFDEQKPWSKLKNRILGAYLSPYLAKVSKLRKKIVLVDAFAGPGKFTDGSVGSPLIICSAAERYAEGKYKAYFYNNNRSHHDSLSITIKKRHIKAAHAIFGDAIDQLGSLIADLRDETLFLYIDPFGLNCEFDILRPLLERETQFSTEILINLHMPITHRLGSRRAVQSTLNDNVRIQKYHEKLTRVFGGEYWKDILFKQDLSNAKEIENALINQYRERLASTGYLTYTGSCPIREKTDSATKYVMVFASPHPDALILLNDEMCKAFNDHMHSQWVKDTLFAGSSWTDWRDEERLQDLVVEYVGKFPEISRKELWLKIITDYFMLFTGSEYRKAVKVACESGRILCVTPIERGGIRPTNRLNDHCVFRFPDQQRMF